MKWGLVCIRGNDTAARLGGDEFVLVLVGIKNSQECEVILNRVIEDLSKPIVLKDAIVSVGASIGVTLYPMDGEDKDTLIRHADKAMYEAKEGGKNRYCFFDHAHEQKMKANQSAIKKIKKGMENGEFCLFYQPKVDCMAGEVIGMEALIRWKHPIFGIVSPSQFLPLIEHEDLIIALGEFVIKEAVKQMNIWREIGLNINVSVNIAAKHLRRTNFFDSLCAILDECKYDKEQTRLEIEIVETAALEDIVVISNLIEKSKPIGVSYSLDDFGTGYSSLTHLKNIRVNTLKIDQSFVIGMLENSEDLAIAEGIVALSHAFDRKVVAEGVESIEHILLLLEIGCDAMQGYAIAKPMPAVKVIDWVRAFAPDPRWALASGPRPTKWDFNLLLAEANLKYWADGVILALKECHTDRTSVKLPSFDPDNCRFGYWYHGEGRKKYSEFAEFAEIEPLHQSLHFFAKEMSESINALDLESYAKNEEEFQIIFERLTKVIHKLKRASTESKSKTIKRNRHE